jgi:hypothetical protein
LACGPGARLLELGGQSQQGGLVAEAAEEVDADGQPSAFHHSGTDIAGAPVMLATTAGKPRKLRDRSAARSGSAGVETISPSGTGGSDRVGVSQASTPSWAKNRATTRANACRSSRASR